MKRFIVLVTALLLVFALAGCETWFPREGPADKNNTMPHGRYTGPAGTMVFYPNDHRMIDTMLIELEPDYEYLLGGHDNNSTYYFGKYDRDINADIQYWYTYTYSAGETAEEIETIIYFDFVWNRAGWEINEDEIIFRDGDTDYVFKFESMY